MLWMPVALHITQPSPGRTKMPTVHHKLLFSMIFLEVVDMLLESRTKFSNLQIKKDINF